MKPEGDRWLVFGFCYAMSPDIKIEELMPEWVMRVAGFIGEPRAPEVAQLMAGITTNLKEWVQNIMAKTDEILTKAPPSTVTPWKATEIAFNSAADLTPDDPAKNNLPDDRENIIIASRDPDTLTWTRKSGTDFLKSE